MKFSYSWLQELIKDKLPEPKKLAEILTMHSFETNVVAPMILEADILPNRAPDCLSHLGLVREICAILGFKRRRTGYLRRLMSKSSELKIIIDAPDLCLRYQGIAIKNIKIASSPKWLARKLEDCGLRPINNAVDITNYVMLEYGQPLHVFDFDKINESKIIVRRARKEEDLITLDNKKRDLDESILVIADAEKPIALAGIMGGENTAVDEKTANIILEIANFDSASILRTSKKLGIRTESSIRFEKGIDPNLVSLAGQRAASLICQLTKGKIAGGVDIYPKKNLPKKIFLDIDYLYGFLGMEISPKEIIDILRSLEFGVEKKTIKKLLVTAPTFRQDISSAQDLIEEIGRIFGYEKILPVMPAVILGAPERNDELFYENQLRQGLVKRGLTEVFNYSFIGEKEAEIFGYKDSLVEIYNPVSVEQKYLRPSLLPNLLKNVKSNLRFFNPEQIKLFEAGRVFFEKNREQKRLAGIYLAKECFLELKGILDGVLNDLGVSDIWYDDAVFEKEIIGDFKNFQPDRAAQIKIGNDLIGCLGEINLNILNQTGINPEIRVGFFDCDLEKIIRLATEEKIYTAPSKYPAIVRDLSVLAEPETKIERVLNILETAGGELLRDIDLFDWYEGEEVGDKKSLNFRLIFQSDEKTLSDSEVNKLQEKIIKAAEDEGWEVRK